MDIDSIDFENTVHKEPKSARDTFHAEMKATQAKWAIKARQFGDEVIGRAVIVGTGNKTPEYEYNCRLYSVLAMIDTPLLANRHGALAATWQELYKDIPYNSYMTSKFVSQRDKDTITQALKDAGVWKRFKFDSIGAVIKLIKQHAINTELQVLRDANKLKQVQLDIDDDGNFYYSGVLIHKLSRGYKVTIDGASISVPPTALNKLMDIIDFIDTHED